MDGTEGGESAAEIQPEGGRNNGISCARSGKYERAQRPGRQRTRHIRVYANSRGADTVREGCVEGSISGDVHRLRKSQSP